MAVTDLDATARFYEQVLGLGRGRSAERWIDYDCFGHQLSCHLVDEPLPPGPTNEVDGHAVPVRHFGVILDFKTWDGLKARIDHAGVDYLVPPHVRFAGEPGEQRTFFIQDPAGNALEFKGFADLSRIFDQ